MLVTIRPLLIANYHSIQSYMISFSLTVEFSEGDLGDDDDHSSDEDYEPSINLSIR